MIVRRGWAMRAQVIGLALMTAALIWVVVLAVAAGS